MAGSSNLSHKNKQIHHVLVTKQSLRLQLLTRWSTVHWVAWLLLFLLLPPVWFDPLNISHVWFAQLNISLAWFALILLTFALQRFSDVICNLDASPRQIIQIKVCVFCPHRPQDEQDPGREVSCKVGLLHQLIIFQNGSS